MEIDLLAHTTINSLLFIVFSAFIGWCWDSIARGGEDFLDTIKRKFFEIMIALALFNISFVFSFNLLHTLLGGSR